MPLVHSSSKKAFKKNLSTEMHEGKPMKQSLAIAYAMKKKGKKMAQGGRVQAEDDRMLNQHGEYEVGAEGMDQDNESTPDHMDAHDVENQTAHEDMVGRIMAQRGKHYAKGGPVTSKMDSDDLADFDQNDFDYLDQRNAGDEADYTGANSGDDLGDARETWDRKDTVAEIMKSRRLTDRMPKDEPLRMAEGGMMTDPGMAEDDMDAYDHLDVSDDDAAQPPASAPEDDPDMIDMIMKRRGSRMGKLRG
jgi:hypothetical protein